jgi:hypothetical protein
MIRSSEETSIVAGLNYYLIHKRNVPVNLFTTIIDYIILNIQNSITGSLSQKYNFVKLSPPFFAFRPQTFF